MLRKICLMLALAALLTAALLRNTGTAKASPDMQTITLNTGYNHATQLAYGISNPDSFWTVIQDPSPSTSEPRPADTITPHPAWKPVMGISDWISYSKTGSAPAPLKGTYVYQKCFCLTKALWENPEAIKQSSLDLSARADDVFWLGLNTMPGPSGGYLIKNAPGMGGFGEQPMTLSIKGEKLLSLLRPGSNCLTVRVDDVGYAITGLNIMGSLTTTGVDGIASNSPPVGAAQYAGCSACARTRPDSNTEVKSEVKPLNGLLTPGRPEK